MTSRPLGPKGRISRILRRRDSYKGNNWKVWQWAGPKLFQMPWRHSWATPMEGPRCVICHRVKITYFRTLIFQTNCHSTGLNEMHAVHEKVLTHFQWQVWKNLIKILTSFKPLHWKGSKIGKASKKLRE